MTEGQLLCKPQEEHTIFLGLLEFLVEVFLVQFLFLLTLQNLPDVVHLIESQLAALAVGPLLHVVDHQNSLGYVAPHLAVAALLELMLL